MNFSLVLFILFLIHTVFNLERYIFINEVFSLVGLYYLITNSAVIKSGFDNTLKCLFFFIAYGFLHIIYYFTFNRVSTNYEFLRTIPVWYSCFAFFVGVYFIKNNFLTKVKLFKKYSIIILIATLISKGRLSPQILLPHLKFNVKHYVPFFIVFFFILKGGATSYVSILVYLLYLIFKGGRYSSIILSKYTLLGLFAVLLILINYVSVEYASFIETGDYALFNKSVDNNTIWRFMFWAYEFKENVKNNIFTGIGFGTPLFDLETVPKWLTSDDGSRMTPFTLGTHNSLFFILIRMGLLGVIPIILINYYLLKRFFKYRLYRNYICESYFISYLFISISMLFNVVMESPLYAGIYWITIGMFYGYQQICIKKIKFYLRTLTYEK